MSLSQIPPEQLAIMPVMPPPPNQTSNFYNNPPTIAPACIKVVSVFLGLAVLTVTMRLYSRISIVKRAGADDWSALLAVLFAGVLVGESIFMFNTDTFGRNSWNVRLVDFMAGKVQQGMFTSSIMPMLSNCFAKASIFLFISRLFPSTVRPKSSWIIKIGFVINCIANVILVLYYSIQCAPRAGSSGAMPTKCTATRLSPQVGQASAALNAAMDLWVLAVAVPCLWVLQMPMKRKLSVIGILGLGLGTCAISIVTLYRRVAEGPQDDPLKNQAVNVTLGCVEPLLAIKTASLPAMPALFVAVSTTGVASLRRLISRIGSATSLATGSKRSAAAASDGDSSRSLNEHELVRISDAERGQGAKTFYMTATTHTERSGSEGGEVGKGEGNRGKYVGYINWSGKSVGVNGDFAGLHYTV